MTRLSVYNYLESEILHQVPERRRVGPVNFSVDTQVTNNVLNTAVKVAYTLKLEVTLQQGITDNQEGLGGREKAVRMLSRALYRDLTAELEDLLGWVMQENIGADLEAKVGRLLNLTRGESL